MRTYTPRDATPIPSNAERVFKGEIYDVWQWDQQLKDGSTKKFEMLKRPDTVVAICVTNEGKILLNDEIQPHLGSFLSLPGGRHDVASETELDAIKREIKEETGHTFKNWKLIKADQLQSKIDHFLYVFVAYEHSEMVEQKLDSGEEVTVIEVSFTEFQKKAVSGLIRGAGKELTVLEGLESSNDLLDLEDLYSKNDS